MKRAFLLPGMPDKTEFYNPNGKAQSDTGWFPWIRHELCIRDIPTMGIEWPRPYEPVYKAWLKVFEQFDADSETILIAHSCGAGFLVRWLTQNDVQVGKVILVAPWMNPFENEVPNGIEKDFFHFEIDPKLVERTKGITVFYSDDDFRGVVRTAEKLEKVVSGIKMVKFHGYGHFDEVNMKTPEFPELLAEAIL